MRNVILSLLDSDTQLGKDHRRKIGIVSSDKELELDPQSSDSPLWYVKVWAGMLLTSLENRTLAAVRRCAGGDDH